jgi:hypothetical protein
VLEQPNAASKEFCSKYRDIKGHTVEFSKKKPTYDSDALNVLLGIFKAVNNSTGTLFKHLHGWLIDLPMPLSAISS